MYKTKHSFGLDLLYYEAKAHSISQRTCQFERDTQHNSKSAGGVHVAMVMQQIHEDSHKQSDSHVNGEGKENWCQRTDTQASMHCNHGCNPASLCPPMKGRLWGLFLDGLKASSLALEP